MNDPGTTGTAPRETVSRDWSGHVPDDGWDQHQGQHQGQGARVVSPRGPGDDAVQRPARTGRPALPALPALATTPLARMVLARARSRAAIPLDIVTFAGRCPACGQDCEWVQERLDTRVRSTIGCTCSS